VHVTVAIPGFRMGELLGEGATGSVYAARDAQGAELAVKVLREAFADDPDMVTRFQREASIAQHLRSEFIAQVVSAGRTQGRPWIAYRRLRGETLAQRLQRELVLERSRLVPIIEHVLRGLAVAHAAGVVHRDVTPGNIMLERIGAGERACILDFGISKHRGARSDGGSSSTHSLTSETATLGTIDYMPPEQIGGSASVDHRADLYAVGVVAYRAISGQLPHRGGSLAEIMATKLDQEARSLGAATGMAWPPGIEGFFEQALARDAAGRFSSAAAMGTAWRHATASEAMPAVSALREMCAETHAGGDTVVD
jgi:serine/threonine protein kinase